MSQRSLGDYGGGIEEDEPQTGPRAIHTATDLLDEDADPLDPNSCPWCLAPDWKFVIRDNGIVGCSNCDAVIPVDAKWYQNGEKIVL